MEEGTRFGRGARAALGLLILALLVASLVAAARYQGWLFPGWGPTAEERPPLTAEPVGTAAVPAASGPDQAAPEPAARVAAAVEGGRVEPEPVTPAVAARGDRTTTAPGAVGASTVARQPSRPAPAPQPRAPAPAEGEAAADLDTVVAALADDGLRVAPERDAPMADPDTEAQALDLDTVIAAMKAADWGGELFEPDPKGAAAIEAAVLARAAPAWAEEPAVGLDAREAQRGAPAWTEKPLAAAHPGRRPPTFDIVRVAADGRAVIAGRAGPGEVVELRVDERIIDRVEANRRGQWVAVPAEPLAVGSGELTLRSLAEGAPPLPSEEIVVLAVPGQGLPLATAALDAEPADPLAGREAEPRARQALAVVLPKEGAGAGRLLQAPGGIRAGAGLALRVIDYDHLGRVRLAGEAQAGELVRVYVDDAPAAEVRAAEDGAWLTYLDQSLEPGSYALRIEQLDADGNALARLETPFRRAAAPPSSPWPEVDHVIVQPGNSLWRIARRIYGEGFQYVHIYEANRDQIRDADLIYPGQIFGIPALD